MPGERNNNQAAFFDLDLTLTYRDSFRLFLKTYYLKNISGLVYLPYVVFFAFLRKLRVISLQRFKEYALIGFSGRSMDEIRDMGEVFFEKHLKNTLREKAVLSLKKHKKRGDLVFIVTASPDIYVHAVSRYLACDGYVCSDLALADNRFTGRINGSDCIGEEKMRRLRMLAEEYRIDLSRSFAYSDHEADLPFLEAAGNKIAVSPSVTLFRIASDRGWDIAYW